MAILTLLSAITGFAGSIIPEVVGFFKTKQDNKQTLDMLEKEMSLQGQTNDHELVVMQRQSEIALQEHSLKIEELDVTAANEYDVGLLDIQKEEVKKDGWVAKYISSVRPTITYSFFLLYASLKAFLAYTLLTTGALPAVIIAAIWTEIDMSIFVTIVSFWFGRRSIDRMNAK